MHLNWTIAFPKTQFPFQFSYNNHFFLIGSCFTEHIGNYLKDLKFQVVQNPAGILFDPLSIAFHLIQWSEEIYPSKEEFFYYQELWHHWKFHTQFSSTDLENSYQLVLGSVSHAIENLKKTDWLIVTLGSSYSYQLTNQIPNEHLQKYGLNYPVANCHKCPNQWFHKYLTPIQETFEILNHAFNKVKKINPKIQFLINISPVRHLRDGVVENNRSKARLIEATHLLVENRKDTFYLPSYELVIDVLRDYRFYDVDKAHPNYEATQWVIQYFIENYFSEETQEFLKEVHEIRLAYQHQPKNPQTQAHQKFLQSYYEKTLSIQKRLPFLNWDKELEYFGKY